mmetsp:Transcript_60972/g.101358  ORF Transcript_60972/g.101358 Transcript_60972/m.101358 type:complete len:238 (+) Transcript_60972:401-1114(+)
MFATCVPISAEVSGPSGARHCGHRLSKSTTRRAQSWQQHAWPQLKRTLRGAASQTMQLRGAVDMVAPGAASGISWACASYRASMWRSASQSGSRSSGNSFVSPAATAARPLATSTGHAPALLSGTPGDCHALGAPGLRNMMRHIVRNLSAGRPVSTMSKDTPIAYPSVISLYSLSLAIKGSIIPGVPIIEKCEDVVSDMEMLAFASPMSASTALSCESTRSTLLGLTSLWSTCCSCK